MVHPPWRQTRLAAPRAIGPRPAPRYRAPFDNNRSQTKLTEKLTEPSAAAISRVSQGTPAGLLRRLGAMSYDALLIAALWLTTSGVLSLFFGGGPDAPPEDRLQPVPPALLQPVLVVELFAFFAFFWFRRGQTLGMLAWKLRVRNITSDDPQLTLQQILLRFIGATLAWASAGLGYLYLFLDPQRRALPDLLSGTQVFFEPKRPEQPKP